jgi:hypothetical protein
MSTPTVTALPRSLRERIAVDEAGHWVWTGPHTARDGVPIFSTSGCAARVVWNALEQGHLMAGEGVYRDCDRHSCVHPHHQEVRLSPKGKRAKAGAS